MEETGPETSSVLSRNYLLKRKRGKIPAGTDKSSGNGENYKPAQHQSTTSSKCGPKDDGFDQSSGKRMGDDGYYYECTVCDLGGTLLCCDFCPRTYHLECLEPALKHIPKGKWECPICCAGYADGEGMDHLDTIPKQARSGNITRGSESETNTSTINNVNQGVGNSNVGRKRSSGKEKSSLSRRGKGVEGSDINPNNACSNEQSHAVQDGPVDSVDETITPAKGFLSKRRNSNRNAESFDKVTEKSPSGDEPALAMEAATRASRKRKHDVQWCDVAKKHKVEKDKAGVDICRKGLPRAKAVDAGTSKSPGKHKLALHKARSTMSKQGATSDSVDNQPNDMMVSEEALHEPLISEDNACGDQQKQVDWVVGSRVQGANDQPLAHTLIAEDLSTASEEYLNEGWDLVGGGNSFEDRQDVASCSDGGVNIKNDKPPVHRRLVRKLHKERNFIDSLKTEITGSGFKVQYNKNQDENISCSSAEKTANTGSIKMSMGTTIAPNKKLMDPCMVQSKSSSVSFEFLVKWVGKSHIHNSWISETELKVLAKRKLDNYKAKYGAATMNMCQEQWKTPQRVIATRSSSRGSSEVLVKWAGLPYDECTWERMDEPAIAKSNNLVDLFFRFEQQALENDTTNLASIRRKGGFQQSEITTLTEQPEELVGGSLFPHQLEALNWLRKSWHRSRNVILADEMGLGKTVSACAFISSLYFEFKATLPCLVLVPLSTMPNWMSEFALWAPDVNVVEYHGSTRARAAIRQYEWHACDPHGLNKKTAAYKFNVLLTTYEMVLCDSSHLRGVPWEVLIVDEGHRLKNSGSKLFGMLNTFSFQHRVLLTGTPLQNNIGEMYNLLNFLQPASFPSLSSFEEKFNDLTTEKKVEELKKFVAPYMLRRLKKDAMQNIPPKIERVVPVELSSIQAEYYRAMLTKNYQILRNVGKGVPQQSMLNIVMQLRKVCNHPYLIPGTEPESGSVEFLQEMRIKASAKLTLLHSMLKFLHKEGHRVLIFSQMTKLLDILEDYLSIEFGPNTYERVDGSVAVADRQAAISRFNQDKSRFVFLLSTRSCGLGINLATADTVIIYDSDFNPHADIQAMNRAHRIGQSKRLLVYRLFVRASVEERILQLAKKKLMLDQLFVNKSGSQKEVEDILKWGTEELFNDSSTMKDGENHNEDEARTDMERSSRRRTGGLGDVYKDKCADGTKKIVWDESAILRLLDRTNLHPGSSDNAESELENGMLGSVKAVEWNTKSAEEEVGMGSDMVDDNMAGTNEENEWDRLLRVRWEKYQNEEEAALGRGKRQRKAITYSEAYVTNLNEMLSESEAEEEREREAEEEQEREAEPKFKYTPAGRALKEKYAKLRARQKERLAKRSSAESSSPRKEKYRLDSIPQPHSHKGPAEYTVNSGAFCSDSQEKMSAKLPFWEKLLPRYSFPGANLPSTGPDLLPKLSLGPRVAETKDIVSDLPMLPLLPNFRFPPDPLKYNQARQEIPSSLVRSLCTETHTKALEDIILGARTAAWNNLLKKKSS